MYGSQDQSKNFDHASLRHGMYEKDLNSMTGTAPPTVPS